MTVNERPARRIVVGVDGSAPSVRAPHWAMDQAHLTDAVVEAVNAWDLTHAMAMAMIPGEDLASTAGQALADAVKGASQRRSDVTVRSHVIRGHPAEVLLDRASDAGLLVVGSHGHGGFTGALLGSVSHRRIQHATCPVVVVRAAPDADR